MTRRALIFSTAYRPFRGGAEIAIQEITDRLDGWEFDLITARLRRDLPRREKLGRVNIYRVGWGTRLDKLWLAYRGGVLSRRLQRGKKYDLVWGMMASFGGLAAADFKKKTDAPFLLTLQEGDDLAAVESKMAPLWWKFKNVFNSADRIQAISNYLGGWAKKMGARAPVVIVPNGVDLKVFYRDQSRLDNGRDLSTGQQKIIFTASRLVRKNAVDVIIKALAELPDNFSLRIAGGGEEEAKLKKLAGNLGLKNRVEFLGNLSHQKIARELQQADLFTRPSRSEGLGNSFLEAMAAGVSVIGTPVGGIPDFLIDNETGFIVPVDNAGALAEKIKFVTNPQNQQKVLAVVNNAQALVKQNYDWDKIALQMEQIFTQLIS